MRQLRFVTLTEDGEHVLLSTADGSEQFALAVDAPLREAVRADLPRLAPVAAVAEPASLRPEPVVAEPLGPRDIQMRVRAGESPQELAVATGMSLERVLRFAGPVVEERKRIADESRRARARRTSADGTEPRIVVFGEAVDGRFTAYGVDIEAVTWDSRRREDGEWIVIAAWPGGAATHTAEWLFSRASRSVTPMDDTAADLLSDRPIRPVAPPEPVRPTLAAAPPLVPGVVAFPPMPDAHTGPLPKVEDVFDQEAPPEGPRVLPPLVPAGAVMDYDAPPLPLGITDPATRPGTIRNLGVHRREESEDEKAARARIPSWDDILLGIRRKD